jgi:hypothetical protein
MRSRPVLWLPSEVWFEFLSRRVEEIQRTQIQLRNHNPPNMGIITGVLNHMLRCIVSTPIVYDFHVRESLALLKCRIVVEKAGMFFLHDLDLDFLPCLDDVQESDDLRVLFLMGVNAKAQRDRGNSAEQQRRLLEGFDQMATFPIGPRPTWSQLTKAIAANPVRMLKEWSMPGQLQGIAVAVANLFCQFTQQLWMMVGRNAMKGMEPTPGSLSDAMRCWTAASIDETLLHATFKACNTGQASDGATPGCQGPRSESFASRKLMYFPSATINSPPRKDSDWSVFWSTPGYIASHHQLMDGANAEESAYIVDALQEIFSHLQCLPASQRATKKSKGHVWKVQQGSFVFVTNPLFYKIERVAKENKKSRGTLRGGRLLKSKKIFQKALCQTDPFDKSVISDHSKRQARLEGLSMVTKNKRKPPQRVSKPRELAELSSDDDDELQAPLMKSVRFDLSEEPHGGSDSEVKAQEEEESQDEEQWESSNLDDDDDNSEW